MDFKTQIVPASGLAALAADGLLVVLASEAQAQTLDKPLAAELAKALKDGDFLCKPGQVLYAHSVAGVKAARVGFAFAGGTSAKGLRKAVAAGLGMFKSGGTRSLAVVTAGFESLGAEHGEAVVAAVTEGLYVYRDTKPSAPAPGKLRSVTVVCDKAQAAAVNSGLRVGMALAAGTTLARECANRPANLCTPTHLADQQSHRHHGHAGRQRRTGLPAPQAPRQVVGCRCG